MRGSDTVTDPLDRLAGPAGDLLDRVDDALIAHGFPAGHPIVPLLRRLGALPSDVARAVSAPRPEPLRATGSALRRHAEAHRQSLPPDPTWAGAAGGEFEAQRAALAGFLDAGGERLRATADYLDEVADWIEGSRRDLAYALADVLGSAAAVRLCDPVTSAEAAASIGARVLRVADDALTAGRELTVRWAGRLDEVPYASSPPALSGPERVDVDLS
jgi:hypothetical protein